MGFVNNLYHFRMANTKRKQTREERIEKKRIAKRNRKKIIRSNSVQAEQLLRKEREIYHRKKTNFTNERNSSTCTQGSSKDK